MTRGVSLVGVGMIPFGRYPEATHADIAVPAISAAMDDAGARPTDLDVAFCGTSFGGMLTGQRVLRELGMTGPPITNVENACSSGSTAIRQAYLGIQAGAFDTALVFGVDKLTQFGGGTLPLEVEDHEVRGGMVMPALYAMRAQRYLYEHGYGPEDLAAVAVKSREHARSNPYAQLRKRTTVGEVLSSRPIADPLTLFQCCPTGDGAAAVILVADELAGRFTPPPVHVLASVLESGRYEPGHRDMTRAEITIQSAELAYEQAGLGPDDIDVAEIHDAFTIAELMYYEAFGFCDVGEAPKALAAGETSLGGRVAVNPSGGLLSRGHPIGATGVGQVVEIVWQLRGECGERQAEGARIGLAHATGGGLAGLDHGACCIHILGR
jgi:acetyl-CoA acetyltransferase